MMKSKHRVCKKKQVIRTSVRPLKKNGDADPGPLRHLDSIPSINVRHSRQISSVVSEQVNIRRAKSLPEVQQRRSTSIRKVSQDTSARQEKPIAEQTETRETSGVERTRRTRAHRRRKCFKWACCPCSPLLALLLTLAGVLLAVALTAALVALLSKSSSSSSSTSTAAAATTTTVSSTSASTTTSATTVSSTSTTETSTSTSATTVTSASTSTVGTTSTSATSTTTSATTTVPMLSIGVNDTLVGLWQTTAGGSGTLATPGWNAGNYVAAEPPRNAFDSNCLTKFTSFGTCSISAASSAVVCGLQTGFYVTLQSGARVMKALQFCTGNDNPPRDPLTMTLEGSNQTGAALMLGSSWSLIYNGATGLAVDPGRGTRGVKQSFSSNAIAYSSYRILVTSKRAADIVTQYSELDLFAF